MLGWCSDTCGSIQRRHSLNHRVEPSQQSFVMGCHSTELSLTCICSSNHDSGHIPTVYKHGVTPCLSVELFLTHTSSIKQVWLRLMGAKATRLSIGCQTPSFNMGSGLLLNYEMLWLISSNLIQFLSLFCGKQNLGGKKWEWRKFCSLWKFWLLWILCFIFNFIRTSSPGKWHL